MKVLSSIFRITKCIKQFGEDPAKMTAEEFFSTFDTFIQSFIEAKIDNENMRKKQEEEEKRARIEAEVGLRDGESDSSQGKGVNAGRVPSRSAFLQVQRVLKLHD